MKPFDLDHIFKYHAPTPETLVSYSAIREAAKAFAVVLVANTPEGADQAAALRLVREASMTANAAVALGGRLNVLPNCLPSPEEGPDPFAPRTTSPASNSVLLLSRDSPGWPRREGRHRLSYPGRFAAQPERRFYRGAL